MIATGCEDKNVRVYYVATSSDQPLKIFSGHTAKVFHVRWSPLREGILCSGSDDGYVILDSNFLVLKIISLQFSRIVLIYGIQVICGSTLNRYLTCKQLMSTLLHSRKIKLNFAMLIILP